MIIIGAGIGGLSTGCYAQMSGMRTRILEKHVLPGGCCTAWSREDYLFDYCIEWLIGTAAGNDANRIWRELGALDGKSITNFEMFNRVTDEHGRSVTFYHDPDRLERHLLELSPPTRSRSAPSAGTCAASPPWTSTPSSNRPRSRHPPRSSARCAPCCRTSGCSGAPPRPR